MIESRKKKNMSLSFGRHLLKTYQSTCFQWEGIASRNIANASIQHLKKSSRNADPNVRILAIELLGTSGDKRVIPFLIGHLNDDTQNTPAGIMQCDDDEVIYVGATAAESLVSLGYATDVESVYKRAQNEGIAPIDCSPLHNIR